MSRFVITILLALNLAGGPQAVGTEWFVVPGGTGDGSLGNPFGAIQDGIDAAQPGDTVTVSPGTFTESLDTVRDGTAVDRITIRSTGTGQVIVTSPGRVLEVDHAYLLIEGLTLDGQYGGSDLVRVRGGADFLTLRAVEIKRSARDCVDMSDPEGVLIEDSLIHHCLQWNNGRIDAHGITGGPVRDLTIRNTEIHTFSGDAVQFDPGRQAPGWDNITLDGCTFWLEPLPNSVNGFPAGIAPGENAVDTKTDNTAVRGTLLIHDTVAYGFRNGFISNMSAFNLKENIQATLDRVTVYDSEIAFRLRGPTKDPPKGAHVTIRNALVYDVDKAFRYEDDLENPKLYNSTTGVLVTEAFDEASSDATTWDVRNLLVLGTGLPNEASGGTNIAVDGSAFVASGNNDYHLADGSPAQDQGETIAEVATDRDGIDRPQGPEYDVGAYEYCPDDCLRPGYNDLFADGFESGDTSRWTESTPP